MIDPSATLNADPGSIAAAYVHLALPGILAVFAALGCLMSLLALPRAAKPSAMPLIAGEG